MNSVVLILNPEEASHLSEMMWLLKGCRMEEEITESINTLEKKINSMAVTVLTKQITNTTSWPTQKRDSRDWPTDY